MKETTKNPFSLEPKEDLIMRSCFIGVCLIVGILLLDIIKNPIFVFILMPIALILVVIPFIRLFKTKSLGG